MSKSETEPIPLTAKEIAQMQKMAKRCKINFEGAFNEYGMFWLVIGGSVYPADRLAIIDSFSYGQGAPYWSQKLLGLSSDKWRIQLEQEISRTHSLRLHNLQNGIVDDLPWSEVRALGFPLGGLKRVMPSAYVLEETGIFADCWQSIEARLVKASRGEDPGHYDNSSYVRVLDSGRVGKEVVELNFFDFGLRRKEILDGVVIGRETKELYSCQYERPLSYERWGKTPPSYNTGRTFEFDWDDDDLEDLI